MLGQLISKNLSQMLGFTGATLALLILIAIGFSLFTGLSWLRFVEKLGALMEGSCLFIRRSWENWQDRRAGAVSAIKRDELVEVGKKRFHEHPPLHIEQPATAIPKVRPGDQGKADAAVRRFARFASAAIAPAR